MANGPILRVSQVLGTPVFQWVIDQLGTRSENNSRDDRDDSNLIYLANKSAWFRIVSSVRVPEFTRAPFTAPNVFNAPNFDKTFAPVTSKTYDYFRKKYPNDIQDEDSLAKKYVLFAGTSAYEKSETGDAFSYVLEQQPYGILGDKEIKEYGRRPMPGITSAQIDTQGSLGSIRSATINFKVWDKEQLDIIDALYFKLGYTMFLEWGNTFYYKTGEKSLYKSEDLQVDPFSKTQNSKEQINSLIQNNIRQSEGNYDGMLGLVTNFNFTFNQEGGYDCTLKIQALGSLGDSIKINHSTTLPALYVNKVLRLTNTDYQKQLQALEQKKADDLNSSKADLEKAKVNLQLVIDSLYSNEITKLLVNYNILDVLEKNRTVILGAGSTSSRVIVADPKSYLDKAIVLRKTQVYEEDNTSDKIFSNTKEKVLAIKVGQNLDVLYVYGNKQVYDPSQIDKTKATLNLTYLNQTMPVPEEAQLRARLTKKESYRNILDYIYREEKTGGFSFSKDGSSYKVKVDFSSSDIVGIEDLLNKYDAKLILESINYDSSSQRAEVVWSFEDRRSLKFVTNDLSMVKDVTYENGFVDKKIAPEQLQLNDLNAKIAAAQEMTNASYNQQKLELDKTNSETVAKQTQEATNYQSALEIMLKTIQLEAYNFAEKRQFNDVYKFDLTETDTVNNVRFIDELFSEGIFQGRITELLNKVDEINFEKAAALAGFTGYADVVNKKYTNQNTKDQFLINAAFGFNHNFMAGLSNVASTPTVKYKNTSPKDNALFNAYILPQNIKGELERGSVTTSHPVYIPLGLLIMMINHTCVMYDGSSPSQLTPMVYMDYNPSTNFCLTNAKQLSTDITKFLIGFQGTDKDYEQFFDKAVLSPDKNTKGVAKLGSQDIWSPQNNDFLTGKIPEFKTIGKTSYQGRLMNVLINLNYAAKLVAQFSYRDGTNSVYLKQFLEQILVDMNKSLGNFNMLRLSYHDPSNAFVIVDDQQTKVADGEIQLTAQNANISELPIFGKKSIARSIELRTDISSRLGSMIAISANSDPSRQVGLSTDASSFGFVNTDFKDRFISIATDIYGNKKEQQATNTVAILNEAQKFDAYIKSIYETASGYDESLVGFSTNYFIQKMSVFKNNEIPTRASAMIPVSLNLSIDGMSGFQMTQLFTIGDNFLPYNYVKMSKTSNPFTSVGFAIVGLTHTIENNQWITSLRTNMAYLRDSVNDYEKDITRTTYSNISPKIVASISISDVVSAGALNKSTTDFGELTKAVIANLEGGYADPRKMEAAGQDPKGLFRASGETMFGLDRQFTEKSNIQKEFWKVIDDNKANWPATLSMGYIPQDPIKSQLVTLAIKIMRVEFDTNVNAYIKNANLLAVINSDGRLLFNFIYATWNGPLYFKKFAEALEKDYNSGIKTSEELLKKFIYYRVNISTIYSGLASWAQSLIITGGKKIATLVGVTLS